MYISLFYSCRKYHKTHKSNTLADMKKGKLDVVVTTYETFRDHIVYLLLIIYNVIYKCYLQICFTNVHKFYGFVTLKVALCHYKSVEVKTLV